jgi:hypothetical protein
MQDRGFVAGWLADLAHRDGARVVPRSAAEV